MMRFPDSLSLNMVIVRPLKTVVSKTSIDDESSFSGVIVTEHPKSPNKASELTAISADLNLRFIFIWLFFLVAECRLQVAAAPLDRSEKNICQPCGCAATCHQHLADGGIPEQHTAHCTHPKSYTCAANQLQKKSNRRLHRISARCALEFSLVRFLSLLASFAPRQGSVTGDVRQNTFRDFSGSFAK